MASPLLALVGPTASGKTEAGIAVAERLGAEIVSVDSMLVYRGMDVGTAKPDPRDRARVPHHLLDVAEPAERFTVARFQALAREAVAGIRRRGAEPLLVGGSGLYFRSIVDELTFPPEDPATRSALETEAHLLGASPLHERLTELDPVAAGRIEPGNVRRTIRALEVAATTGRRFSEFGASWERHDPEAVRAAGVRLSPDVLGRRIEARVAAMLEAGWLEEVRALVTRGSGDWLTSTQAIGYAELARHLEGRLSLAEAVEATVQRTRNLARRQLAWFRRDPRIRWFEAGEAGASELVDDLSAYLGASLGRSLGSA
jgi:tRNA dimethylallyltransferase